MSYISKDKLPILKENGAILNRVLHTSKDLILDVVLNDGKITELEVDKFVENFITTNGAVPSCLNYNGFPNSICISVNDSLVHGIPSNRFFQEGDIVTLDCALNKNGYHVDKAITFVIGEPDTLQYRLLQAASNALDFSIKKAVIGNTIGDISYQTYFTAKSFGFKVCKNYVGHGIGTQFHMQPQVPNLGVKGTGPRIEEGLCIAIEPMVLTGSNEVFTCEDKWTVKSVDGKINAHCEDTIYVTKSGPIIITREEI